MSQFLTIVHLVTCFLIVAVVLLQSGKGSEVNATLGGSSQTLFGSSGGAPFFIRLTGVLAALFMFTSFSLTLLAQQTQKSVFESSRSQEKSLEKPDVKKEAKEPVPESTPEGSPAASTPSESIPEKSESR